MKHNTIKIAAIGDSITYGYPYGPVASWFNITAERLRVDYINQGINGDITDGMLSRFDRDVLRCTPSHVIIMGGTNDAYNRRKASQVVNNIKAMVGLAVQNGIIPILGLPIPCNDVAEEKKLGQYRAEMRQYARNNIDVIDFHKTMVDGSGVNIKEGLHCDGLHPSEDGYEVMAATATTMLRSILDR